MQQTVYDTKRNGLFRDRVQDFLIDKLERSSSMTEAHYHPYYELFYLVKGSCRIFVDHSLFTVNEGEIIILPESTLHRTQYDTTIQRITVSFTRNFLQALMPLLGEDFLKNYIYMGKIKFDSSDRKTIEFLFHELLKTGSGSGTSIQDHFSQIEQKSLVLRLLVFLAKKSADRKDEKTIDERTAIIQKAAKFIFENYSREITLKDAASIAGMRDTYFSRIFQEVTGYGFKEYLLNIRIQHACQMLRTGNLKITQIALACGFSDGNYFGDIFKKRTGLSPREFRHDSGL